MDSRRSTRRWFLKQSTVLAGLAAVGAVQPASGQTGSDARALLDPWTGKPLRDQQGNLLVDWSGTTEWKSYQETIRSMAGPLYGTRDKDYRLYGYRSRYVTTFRSGTDGAPGLGGGGGPTTVKDPFLSLLSPLQDQKGIITPASLHFTDEHGYEPPDIDPRKHRLTIYGMVDRPLTLTMEDLERLPSVTRVHFTECHSNGTPRAARLRPDATPQDICGESSCSEWTGVLVSTLLDMVGVQKGASWIYAESADSNNHVKSIPLTKAMDDCIVAYGQNGEPLRPEQGFPIRIAVPGFHGNNWVKRLRSIKVANEPAMSRREARMYTSLRPDGKSRWFYEELGPKSIILRPSGQQQLPGQGFYEIRGLAWSGNGAIQRVEISTDGSRTWKDAKLQEPVHRKAYTRFTFPWTWNGEEVVLASRCTDDRGIRQPTVAELAKVWGVEPSYFSTPRGGTGHFNAIQPWKVTHEGKVYNALFS
jgi:sulfane dehydrogenase subunit SoxC